MKAIMSACCLGMLVLLSVNAMLWALLCLHFMPLIALYAAWVGPLIAALLTSYKCPRLKILLGALMAIPATLFGIAITASYGDSSDFPGMQGLKTFAAFSLISNAGLCVIGGLLGRYLSMKRPGIAERIEPHS